MKFRDYLNGLPAERRDKIEKETRDSLLELHLTSLREAAATTQHELARRLGISQAAVSKLESRADMLLSTLGKYVQALSGKLSIKVSLPGAELEFTSFEEIMAQPMERAVPLRRISCYARGVPTDFVVVSGAAGGKRAFPIVAHESIVESTFSESGNGSASTAAYA